METMNERSRTDAFSFYSLTIISYLESAVPIYVENLSPFFADNPKAQDWLQSTWLHEEAEHGRLTRTYATTHWPEFDWERGYALFLSRYQPRCNRNLLRASPALEALARCVTETQAAMIYRCLGDYSPDPELKSLMADMSRDEVRHYAYFRDLHDHYDRKEHNALWRKARVVVARSELVREEDLALAYLPLNECWSGKKPFPQLSYSQYFSMMGRVMARHFPFEQAGRMLFRPLRGGRWLESFLVGILARVVRRQYAAAA